MTQSPRLQMQNVLDMSTKTKKQKTAAAYILRHDYWFPVLRNSQAFFRNFVLDLVRGLNELGLDDRKMPVALKSMMDTGYLWSAFNKIKHPSTVSNALIIAANSLRIAGEPQSARNIERLFSLMVEPATPVGRIELIRQDQPDGMWGIEIRFNPRFDPEITKLVLADPAAIRTLASAIDAGVEHTGQALAIVEDGIAPALMNGAL